MHLRLAQLGSAGCWNCSGLGLKGFGAEVLGLWIYGGVQYWVTAWYDQSRGFRKSFVGTMNKVPVVGGRMKMIPGLAIAAVGEGRRIVSQDHKRPTLNPKRQMLNGSG